MQTCNITQVAKRAGVSVATVSRVINQSDSVTPETAKKVLAAIEALGYRPNVWGRSLRRGESRVVLLLVPNVSNPYYAPIIAGAEDILRAAGYSIMLCITNVDAARRGAYLDLLKSGRADGAILMDTVTDDRQMDALLEKYPLVQCCEYCANAAISHVSIDNYQAAREAVLRLIALGHTHIGFVGADNRFISTVRRREGYLAALAAQGSFLRAEDRTVAAGDYSYASGVAAAGQLLDRPDRPTALFCISDVLALGALLAAKERGLRVPEDLSVVGFDDVEYATMFAPRLTTVRQPCYELGSTAATLLLRQMAGEPGGQAHFLPHQLVERDSTAQPCR